MVLGVKIPEKKNPEFFMFFLNMKKAPKIRKNEKFKNRSSSCFKLAQMMSRAKIS